MRERTFRPAVHAFLDTIREGHPDTPVLVISAVACRVRVAMVFLSVPAVSLRMSRKVAVKQGRKSWTVPGSFGPCLPLAGSEQ